MKYAGRITTLLIVLMFALTWSVFGRTTSPPGENSNDKTLSPYFFVKSDDTTFDQLPLRSTSADVTISGVIADVRVTQVYKNEGKKALEAIYVFPASTRAAVYAMKMTIGKRVIQAKINKREEARREYEQAKEQGKRASLLEQQRPNVFQMNVANIMPGDEIKVELKYTELLVPTDKVYEFVYPTVVGPRYSNQPAATARASEHWVQNPYLKEGEAPTYGFDINVRIDAGMPIKDITCPSHKVKVDYDGPSSAKLALDKGEKFGGNRDYVVRYRLDGNRVQSGLLLYQSEKENFFLLMTQPPKRVTKAQIPGREYIFIVDVSGSMWGYPLDISKKLLKDLLGGLRTSDVFNVMLFSGGSSVMAEQSVPATRENIQKAVDLIDRQQGGGATELLPAMTRALHLKRLENYSRTVVIATDGYVQVEEQVFDLIRKNLGNTNVFAFGIGTSVNRHIIEGMAHVGLGESFVATRPEEAAVKAGQFRHMIESPVLTGVKVQFQGFSTYDVEPPHVPDVLSDRPVIVFGKYRGQAQGKITVTGMAGDGPYSETIEVGNVKPQKTSSALKYLWARHRITLLSDYQNIRSDEKRVKEVTDLGLAYNLLTAYTSFVAVDTEVANKDGQATTVKQPLPLPQGVSNYAVGQSSGSTLAYAGGGMMMKSIVPGVKYDVSIAEHLPGNYDGVRKPFASPAPAPTGKVHAAKRKSEAAGSNITISGITVSEGLTKNAVSDVVKENLDALQTCFQGTGITGTVVVKLQIAADGSVSRVTITKKPNGKGVEQCIIDTMKTLQFPATADGREATATITFKVEA